MSAAWAPFLSSSRRAVSAELVKLRGLPVAAAAVLGTVLAAVALAAAVAAAAPVDAGVDAARVVAQILPFLQVGPILLGVIAASSEYAGSQIRASLIAVPVRIRLLAAKTAAVFAALATMSLTSVAAAAGTACIVLGTRNLGTGPAMLVGAACYLVLMGLISFALAMLLRSLVAPLAGMLVLVFIFSPLAAATTEYARWLPDRAGASLYDVGTSNPAMGVLVPLAWLVAVGAAAIVAFIRRDA